MMDYDLFFKLMSEFMEREMEMDLLEEFEELLEDDYCCCYFNTFKKTVQLCHEVEIEEVPPTLHYTLIETIYHTPPETQSKA